MALVGVGCVQVSDRMETCRWRIHALLRSVRRGTWSETVWSRTLWQRVGEITNTHPLPSLRNQSWCSQCFWIFWIW